MNSKKMGLLVGITFVVLLLAIYANQQHDAGLQSKVTGQALYPQLAKQINEVDEVVLESSAGLINIHRNGDQWLVKQRNDYPADLTKIKRAVLGLAEMTMIEAKTRLADSYPKLGVEEPSAQDSKSVRMALKAGAKELASLIVGNQSNSTSSSGEMHGRYVRNSNDPQSWLVKANLSIDKDAKQWLDNKLADIKAERIHNIRFQQTDGSALTVAKEAFDGKDYSVLGLPKGKEIISQSTINNLANALQNLNLQDVLPAALVKADKAAKTAEFQTYDGLRVQITLQQQDEQTVALLKATYAADSRITETEANKGKLKSADEVQKEAEMLQAQWQPWAYVLSSADGNKFSKTLEDITRDKKK